MKYSPLFSVARAAENEIPFHFFSLTLNYFYVMHWLYKTRTYMPGIEFLRKQLMTFRQSL